MPDSVPVVREKEQKLAQQAPEPPAVSPPAAVASRAAPKPAPAQPAAPVFVPDPKPARDAAPEERQREDSLRSADAARGPAASGEAAGGNVAGSAAEARMRSEAREMSAPAAKPAQSAVLAKRELAPEEWLERIAELRKLQRDQGSRRAARRIQAPLPGLQDFRSHDRKDRTPQMSTLHPQVAALLEAAKNSKIPPMHTVSAVEARRIYRETRGKLLPPAPQMALCEDISIPGPAGKIPVRHYRPAGSAAGQKLPRAGVLPRRRLGDRRPGHARRAVPRTLQRRGLRGVRDRLPDGARASVSGSGRRFDCRRAALCAARG